MHPLSRPRTTVAAALAALAALAVVAACTGGGDDDSSPTSRDASSTTAAPAAPPPAIVFVGEGNNLQAYSTEPPFENQTVFTNAEDDPASGRDINAQICFYDDNRRFVAGEDTGQPDPPAGWGIFELRGDTIGELDAEQVGKLTPTYQAGDQPENYGCGVLSDGRIVTTDVGNQATGTGSGQLIIWFPPFDSTEVQYCKLDVELATAQSIYVDGDDNLYVASARPPTGGVYRYSPPFPTGPDAAGGCGRTDATGAPLADAVRKQLFIEAGPNGLGTPAGIAPSPEGGFFVSSVFTGYINEYDASGKFVRTILQPPAGETLSDTSFSTGTPLGIGVGPDGTLYYADIGVVVSPSIGPGVPGSLRRITFQGGEPSPPEVMASGLAFPDGIGVLVPAP